MIYKRRNLQRLWEVVVYVGDRDAKKPKTEKETVIAWNDVDVARKLGDRIAKPPVSLGYVYQDPKSGEWLIIEDTSGPTKKKAKPTVKSDE